MNFSSLRARAALVCALLACFFAAQLLYTESLSGVLADREIASARAETKASWDLPSPPRTHSATAAPDVPFAASSEVVALLTVPRLDEQAFEIPVRVGTGPEALDPGAGMYPGATSPGSPGNIPIVGHRTSHAKPFSRFDLLRPGDVAHLDTPSARYTYVLVEDRVVRDDEIWVLGSAPLPSRATEPLLTLITCTPEGSTSHRWVWFARLESTLTRSPAG